MNLSVFKTSETSFGGKFGFGVDIKLVKVTLLELKDNWRISIDGSDFCSLDHNYKSEDLAVKDFVQICSLKNVTVEILKSIGFA